MTTAREETGTASLPVLQELLRSRYGIDRLDPQASLKDAGIDSLTQVELLLEVEDHFKITFPQRQREIDTLAALAAVVDGLRNQLPA